MAASPATCGSGAGLVNSATSLPALKLTVAGKKGGSPVSYGGGSAGDVPETSGEGPSPQWATAAATAAAAMMPAIASGGKGISLGTNFGGPSQNAGDTSSSSTGASTKRPRMSFGGGTELGGSLSSGAFTAGGGGPDNGGGGVGGGGSGDANAKVSPTRRGSVAAAVAGGAAAARRRGSVGVEPKRGSGGESGTVERAGGNGGVNAGGRPRRRVRRDSRSDGASMMLNVELGYFVYPSLMLEKSVACLQYETSAKDSSGGSRKRPIAGKSRNGPQNGPHKLDRQQTRKERSSMPGVDAVSHGAPDSKSRSPRGRPGARSESTVTLPPLTWVLSAEPEPQPPGVLTFHFPQQTPHGDFPSGGGNIAGGVGSIASSLTAGNRQGGPAEFEPSDDITSSLSKRSGSSFEESLKAGEAKLRDEIHRLHKELKELSGADAKNMKGSAALAASTRGLMNDKTRTAISSLSTKGRASAVQYEKLVNRPGKLWSKATRIVSKTPLSALRAIKNKDEIELEAEQKRREKERHDEEDRRLAKQMEEEQMMKARMTNGRIKRIVPLQEKLHAKETYFAQFQQANKTRLGGYFSGAGGAAGIGSGATGTGAGVGPLGHRFGGDGTSVGGSRGSSRPSSATSAASRPSSRGSRMVSQSQSFRPGTPQAIPQDSDGSKRQATARDLFIVACLELGLHPDLSHVRWNLGGIDLSHLGLGDQLVTALAASLKHSPAESLSVRDNRMTDSPLAVVIGALDVDSLVKLDLSENRLGSKAMKTLCSFLEDGSCLETLVLTATHIGDTEIAPLCETLVDNDMLLSLNLSRNKLRSAGASSLAKMLASPNCGLQELDISWNCCSGKGTVELGEALKHQSSLRSLELAFNSFSDDSTMALALALLDNQHLTSLGMSWNRIGGRASLALSRMLSMNSTLHKLDLSGNPLTETGGRSIVRAIIGGSVCDVAMRGCSFREDAEILFDRNYPPPLISLDLDLKNAFQCSVLHELIGLAQAKPGSKFVEVFRHAGGGRGRVPITLQVVEDLKSSRRASVVDTATGKSWIPPDSGWLSVKFKASRELPSVKDVLSPEAAWTAMMLLMGQDSDQDRMNVLRLILRDTYVTTESGQKLIDQLSLMGIYPRDIVEMVWTRVVDASNLYEFLSRNVEHSARRDVVNTLTHERFKFNWDNPTGHYRLEMHKKSHREIMMLLSMVHSREVLQGKREGRGDTSQAQNWSNFRNASVDKKPVELTESSAASLPASGVLEFDYVSTAKAPADCVHATDAQVQDLQESLRLLPRQTFGGEKPNYMLAVLQLQQAAARYYFSTPQVIRILDCFEHTKLQASAVTALFGRTWDLENFDAVLATLPAGVDKEAGSRLGFLNVLNPLKIARHYELNIMHPDERRLIKLLLDTSPLEKGDNLLEDHTSDLQIIDLYAGLGRLVDEKKPMVVRLWYCDFGVKGNVPNWAVREKLLDKFLVGGKPVPDRVLDIVRMYKRMADGGYLAKEPGMGAADITKAYTRFLKYLQEAKRVPASGHNRGGRRSMSQRAH